MEIIKQGYKKTDIGVIPEDWKVRSVDQCVKLINGRAYKQEELLLNGKYPVLRVGNFFSNNSWYYSDLELNEDQYVNDGDLMYAWSASFGPRFWNGSKTIYHYHIWKVLANKEISKQFLFYLWEFDKEKILKQSQGGTMFHITKFDMGSRKIGLPSELKEQTAIATALSDIDALIVALGKKIAKKQQIKQGAMQQLLTGKKRLPGFSGEWVEKKLGAIGKTYGGLTGKTKDDFGNGDSYYITFLNILNNPVINTDLIERVRIKSTEHQNKALKNDLFFNTSSETPEEVGICSVLLNDIENLYLNSFCFGYRINDNEVHGLFLSYLFRNKQGRELMTSLAQGATRYNLSKSLFNQSLIKMPATKTEQTAIAQILTDMDNEIAQLEKERDKYKELKAGMMQVLLTGKVRLV